MAQELEKLKERLEEDGASQQTQREPPVSPTTEHITLKLQGTMETNRARSEDVQITDQGQKMDRRSQDRVGMTLRSGKKVGDHLMDLSDEDSKSSHMCPIITKTSGRKQYEPWPFMDMIGLAERLPVLTDGADKWIMTLEETTAGIQLAVGDIKAILTYVAGKQTTNEIFTETHLSTAIGTNVHDGVNFGDYRSRVWQQLRAHYPAKREPSKLEGETMGEDECPS
ncbi:hypothetical protein ABVT39_023650 [Epinephelus coioides]